MVAVDEAYLNSENFVSKSVKYLTLLCGIMFCATTYQDILFPCNIIECIIY